jgi:anti-sigma factor RsiW
MKCDRVIELLSEYIDGELSPAGALGVQSHLRRCASCEAEHQALRRTLQLVALYGRQPIPMDCRDAVMAQLRAKPAPSTHLGWSWMAEMLTLRAPAMPSWARATALAALAVVSAGAGSMFFNRPQEMPQVAVRPAALVSEDHARMRESYQLLQALGRDDGYILAADVVDEGR